MIASADDLAIAAMALRDEAALMECTLVQTGHVATAPGMIRQSERRDALRRAAEYLDQAAAEAMRGVAA